MTSAVTWWGFELALARVDGGLVHQSLAMTFMPSTLRIH